MKPLSSRKNLGSKKYPVQTSGNQILLNKIRGRKRGIRNPRVLARKYRIIIKIVIVSLTLGFIGYFLYQYIYLNPKFTVKNISVIGGGTFVNVEDFNSMVYQKMGGHSIFFLNSSEIAETLKSNFLGAKNIDVSVDYPDNLVIKIDERVPLAIISKGKDNPYYLIDVEGYVLGEVSEEFMGLPLIVYSGDINVGTFLEANIVPVSVEILTEAGQAGLDVSSVSFSERYSKLYLGPTEIFISNLKNVSESVKKLEKIYKNLLLEGKSVIKIDLRYDKVIVLYE